MAALAAASTALAAGPAAAHPHVWVDVRVAVLFDTDGRIEGLRQHWTFDELYTLFVVEELTADKGGPSPEALADLARVNIESIAAHSYFTFVEVAGRQPAYGPVTRYENAIEDGRLTLTFTLPLAEPVDPLLQAFSYALYEPTYYVSLLHEEGPEAVTFEGNPGPACDYRIDEANPDSDTLSLAAALDRDQTAGTGLGALFAETVAIRCE